MTELEIVRNKAEEGREAYKNGLARDANPYRYGTARYWQWSSGWCDERAYRPSRSDRKKDDRRECRMKRQRLLSIKKIMELLIEQADKDRPKWEQHVLSRAVDHIDLFRISYEEESFE